MYVHVCMCSAVPYYQLSVVMVMILALKFVVYYALLIVKMTDTNFKIANEDGNGIPSRQSLWITHLLSHTLEAQALLTREKKALAMT